MTAASRPTRPSHPGRGLRWPALLMALLLGASTAGLVSSPAAAAACGPGGSDFDGDGSSDALVADPDATVGGQAKAGRLVLLSGNDARVGEGTRSVITQNTTNIGDTAQAGDRFGFSLATADIDGDGCLDAVVGVPYEDAGATDSGIVQVIWGDSEGLGARGSRQVNQNDFADAIRAGDKFGFAVDAIAATGTDQGMFAAGSPGWDVNGHNDAGFVGFLFAGDDFGDPSSATQDNFGLPGEAEDGDQFGYSISLARLSGAADKVDIVVGIPGEDLAGHADAGSVAVVEDIVDSPDPGLDINQDSPGVPGAVETGDKFGRSLDTTGSSGPSLLAVGAPGEDVGSVANAGSVQLFSSDGTTPTATSSLDQNTPGVGGAAETADLFGDHLAFLVPGAGATDTRLAVSVAYEDIAAVDSGAVQLFPVTDLTADVTYTEDYAGVPGVARRNDRFGTSLGAVVGYAERVLLVGVPDDVDRARGVVDVLPIGASGFRAWVPGIDGVPSTGAARFGQAVASSAG